MDLTQLLEKIKEWAKRKEPFSRFEILTDEEGDIKRYIEHTEKAVHIEVDKK